MCTFICDVCVLGGVVCIRVTCVWVQVVIAMVHMWLSGVGVGARTCYMCVCVSAGGVCHGAQVAVWDCVCVCRWCIPWCTWCTWGCLRVSWGWNQIIQIVQTVPLPTEQSHLWTSYILKTLKACKPETSPLASKVDFVYISNGSFHMNTNVSFFSYSC